MGHVWKLTWLSPCEVIGAFPIFENLVCGFFFLHRSGLNIELCVLGGEGVSIQYVHGTFNS